MEKKQWRKIRSLVILSLSELPFFEKPKSFTVRDSLIRQRFYVQPIEKQKTGKLTNQELLQALPFYDSVSITKKDMV